MDTMKVEILADGTLKVTTDPISAANHQNAELFLKDVARLAGGETTRQRRTDRHVHHEHEHSHEGGEHEHSH